jgi:hypothetical protein
VIEITNSEEMAKFAEDVRAQESAFVAAATQAFSALFSAEYRRLRAAGLESGQNAATLTVRVQCNFNPASRSVDLVSAPEPTQPKPRRRALPVSAAA